MANAECGLNHQFGEDARRPDCSSSLRFKASGSTGLPAAKVELVIGFKSASGRLTLESFEFC